MSIHPNTTKEDLVILGELGEKQKKRAIKIKKNFTTELMIKKYLKVFRL